MARYVSFRDFDWLLWPVGAIFGVGALWSSRLYYCNHSLVGSGDVIADRYQRILWWSTAALATMFVAALGVLLTKSRVLRLTVVPAAAVCGAAVAADQWTRLTLFRVFLLPGEFAVAYFGMRVDLTLSVRVGWILGISVAFYTATGMSVVSLCRLAGNHEGAKRLQAND